MSPLGYARTVARALRVLGEIRGSAGEPDLREAFELLDGSDLLLEKAKTLAALGEVLRSGPASADEARTVLLSALELADLCGADGLRTRIAMTLAVLGVDVPTEPGTRALLTTTERRIAVMAVQGLSEREIAQALFVTPRMVKSMVESVSARLGASTMPELAAALTEA